MIGLFGCFETPDSTTFGLSSLEAPKKACHTFSSALSYETSMASSFDLLLPKSGLLLLTAATTNFAHPQFGSTVNAALAIPKAIEYSKLVKDSIAWFVIFSAFLLQEVFSNH